MVCNSMQVLHLSRGGVVEALDQVDHARPVHANVQPRSCLAEEFKTTGHWQTECAAWIRVTSTIHLHHLWRVTVNNWVLHAWQRQRWGAGEVQQRGCPYLPLPDWPTRASMVPGGACTLKPSKMGTSGRAG